MEDKQRAASKEIAELKEKLNSKMEDPKKVMNPSHRCVKYSDTPFFFSIQKQLASGKNSEQDSGVWRVKAQEMERENEKFKARVKELETQVGQAKQVEEKLRKVKSCLVSIFFLHASLLIMQHSLIY